MSRHRNVRNLDIDDELDEDYGDEEYYDDDDDYYEEDEPQTVAYVAPTSKQQHATPRATGTSDLVESVRSIVGDGFSKEQITLALRQYDSNVERAVNALLGGLMFVEVGGTWRTGGKREGGGSGSAGSGWIGTESAEKSSAPPPGFSGPPPGLGSAKANVPSPEDPSAHIALSLNEDADGFECGTVRPVHIPYRRTITPPGLATSREKRVGGMCRGKGQSAVKTALPALQPMEIDPAPNASIKGAPPPGPSTVTPPKISPPLEPKSNIPPPVQNPPSTTLSPVLPTSTPPKNPPNALPTLSSLATLSTPSPSGLSGLSLSSLGKSCTPSLSSLSNAGTGAGGLASLGKVGGLASLGGGGGLGGGLGSLTGGGLGGGLGGLSGAGGLGSLGGGGGLVSLSGGAGVGSLSGGGLGSLGKASGAVSGLASLSGAGGAGGGLGSLAAGSGVGGTNVIRSALAAMGSGGGGGGGGVAVDHGGTLGGAGSLSSLASLGSLSGGKGSGLSSTMQQKLSPSFVTPSAPAQTSRPTLLSFSALAPTPAKEETLVAKPSVFAEFLVEEKAGGKRRGSVDVGPDAGGGGGVGGGEADVKPFSFDTPSPDDVVKEARGKATKGNFGGSEEYF
ncbi:hypothetical protein HDV00_002676 [Rhizophlyctis rosea]|nr:hypothetical protein HDV00_002676 [Rhizophlyctis rosea]